MEPKTSEDFMKSYDDCVDRWSSEYEEFQQKLAWDYFEKAVGAAWEELEPETSEYEAVHPGYGNVEVGA